MPAACRYKNDVSKIPKLIRKIIIIDGVVEHEDPEPDHLREKAESKRAVLENE